MPGTDEMAIHPEGRDALKVEGEVALRVTRDPAAKRGVYRVQSRSNASSVVNTTVRIISPGMAKVATGRS
jgi:hypothetical protein